MTKQCVSALDQFIYSVTRCVRVVLLLFQFYQLFFFLILQKFCLEYEFNKQDRMSTTVYYNIFTINLLLFQY
jgi:hypothetical protein